MTDRQPSPNAQLSVLLSRFPAKIVSRAKRCLARLRRTFPGTIQLVYDYRHSVVVGFGMSETGSEAIVALSVYQEEVRLYFGAGKSLPDPKGLLQGSASKVRYVSLKTAADLDHRDIKALFTAARKHSGISFPRTGANRMVIKSGSKKKR